MFGFEIYFNLNYFPQSFTPIANNKKLFVHVQTIDFPSNGNYNHECDVKF